MARILVVEDSPTILYMMTDMLSQLGYEILKAANGAEAVTLATTEKPDVILLDVILPKLNGYQVCRQIKSQPQTEHIPVIMITSKGKQTDRHWGLEQGADAYIVKPVDPDELKDVIDKFIPLPS